MIWSLSWNTHQEKCCSHLTIQMCNTGSWQSKSNQMEVITCLKNTGRVQIKVCLSLTRHQPAILSTLIATLKSNLIIWRVFALSLSLYLSLSLSLSMSLSLSFFSSCHVSVTLGFLQLKMDWQYCTQLQSTSPNMPLLNQCLARCYLQLWWYFWGIHICVIGGNL